MSEGFKATPLQSVIAGAAAGGIESMVTVSIFGPKKTSETIADQHKYPTEYVKTRQQLLRGQASATQSPIQILLSTVRTHGVARLYTGGPAFCISNASKSGIRFLTFDTARNFMPKDASGNTTVVGNMMAGVCAGVAESILVLTPGENIKTRLIDDVAGARGSKSSMHVIRSMLTQEGPMGFFRGVWPVTLKQSSNATVRFTSYNLLSSQISPYMGASTSAAAGSLAGVITVYCTMPFDNVKTQMQSVTGRDMYKGSLDCARQLVQRGGLRLLWKGTTPRLMRLSVSGAISFTIYEQVVKVLSSVKASGLTRGTQAAMVA